jgi:hypothetical protein
MEVDYMRRKPGRKYIPTTCGWCPFDDGEIRSEVLGFYLKDHRLDPWWQTPGFEDGATIILQDGDDLVLHKAFRRYEDAVEFYVNLPVVIEYDWMMAHFSYT